MLFLAQPIERSAVWVSMTGKPGDLIGLSGVTAFQISEIWVSKDSRIGGSYGTVHGRD